MTIATFMGDAGVEQGGIVTFGGTAAPTVSMGHGSLTITEAAAAGPVMTQYVGTVLYFSNCVDASMYTGIELTIGGTVNGDCTAQFYITDSEHDSPVDGPVITSPPYLSLTVSATATPMKVPFAGVGAPSGGSPPAAIDPMTLTSMWWQFRIPYGTTCMANLTISNVSFF
jgi:hypothetical protein